MDQAIVDPQLFARRPLLWLEQAGWRIEYLEYQDGLPSRLRLTYPGIELRLAISKWGEARQGEMRQ